MAIDRTSLGRAYAIAATVHQEQTDKAGAPYFDHLANQAGPEVRAGLPMTSGWRTSIAGLSRIRTIFGPTWPWDAAMVRSIAWSRKGKRTGSARRSGPT